MTNLVRVVTLIGCGSTDLNTILELRPKCNPKHLSTDKNYALAESKIRQSRKLLTFLVESSSGLGQWLGAKETTRVSSDAIDPRDSDDGNSCE
jgi:hypothetical protein